MKFTKFEIIVHVVALVALLITLAIMSVVTKALIKFLPACFITSFASSYSNFG